VKGGFGKEAKVDERDQTQNMSFLVVALVHYGDFDRYVKFLYYSPLRFCFHFSIYIPVICRNRFFYLPVYVGSASRSE